MKYGVPASRSVIFFSSIFFFQMNPIISPDVFIIIEIQMLCEKNEGDLCPRSLFFKGGNLTPYLSILLTFTHQAWFQLPKRIVGSRISCASCSSRSVSWPTYFWSTNGKGFVVCLFFASRVYGMLLSVFFSGFPEDYLHMFCWVKRRINLSNSLASSVDENERAVP